MPRTGRDGPGRNDRITLNQRVVGSNPTAPTKRTPTVSSRAMLLLPLPLWERAGVRGRARSIFGWMSNALQTKAIEGTAIGARYDKADDSRTAMTPAIEIESQVEPATARPVRRAAPPSVSPDGRTGRSVDRACPCREFAKYHRQIVRRLGSRCRMSRGNRRYDAVRRHIF